MDQEVSRGSNLGVVLIALAAIIGLGFAIFAIAKGTANEGVTNVQEVLGAVGASAFTDYDQKIITGTQVVSAYQNFEGKPYAVIIATQATKDKSGTSTTHSFKDGAGVTSVYPTSGTTLEIPVANAYNGTATNAPQMDAENSAGTKIKLKFVNYNALLGKTGTNVFSKVYFDANCWRAIDGFQVDSGKVQMNNISANLSRSGMMEYVPSGARYQSYLIKDLSGTIMGVAFEQVGTR